MKFTPATRYEIMTEGGARFDAETTRLTKGWFRAATISTGATGIYTYESTGSIATEPSTTVSILVPSDIAAHNLASILVLLPVDKHLIAEGRDIDASAMVETYVGHLADAIGEANGQECVLVVRTDANGPAMLFV